MTAPEGKNKITAHAHTQKHPHPHMMEVTAVLLPINGDKESRRGPDKTYVLISLKG